MAQIPTAKQVYYKVTGCILEDHHFPNIEEAMVEYAKMHVEAALKEASEKAETVHDGSFISDLCNMSKIKGYENISLNDLIYKPSILNSYPLTNIK